MDDMNNHSEPLIEKLRMVIRFSIRALAVLMTLVILWGVVEPEYIFATATLVFATSIGYWLVVRYADARAVSNTDVEQCFEHPEECHIEESARKI